MSNDTKEKVSIEEICDHRSVVGHCVLTILTDLFPKHPDFEKFFEEKKEVSVELIIDGEHKVSLRDFLNRFEKHFDRETEKKALSLVQDKMGEVFNTLNKLNHEIKYKARELFPHLTDDDFRY